MTIQLWVKVVIATIPAMVFGLLFDDYVDEHFMNAYVVAGDADHLWHLIYRCEKKHEGVPPESVEAFSADDPDDPCDRRLSGACDDPGTSRSGATILGGLLIGASRSVAAEFTFFLAIPVMFGWSFLKMLKFGFAFTGQEFFMLLLGCAVFIRCIGVRDQIPDEIYQKP